MKRLIDFAGACIGLVALSPLFLLTIVIIRVKMGPPVFFRQQRPGRHGRPFTILKFRTLSDERDEAGRLLPDSQRMTPFGRFLRSTSIDEIPELINVLKGEMSLVGPRPLLMEYLPLYSPDQARRHGVKPGITGWAQVNGRNAISWEDKFKLDLWYIDHRSFWLDMKILWMTALKVLNREGISQRGSATMEKFAGKEGRT